MKLSPTVVRQCRKQILPAARRRFLGQDTAICSSMIIGLILRPTIFGDQIVKNL